MSVEKNNTNLPEQKEQDILNAEELENLEGGVDAQVEESVAFLRQGVSHCCNGTLEHQLKDRFDTIQP